MKKGLIYYFQEDKPNQIHNKPLDQEIKVVENGQENIKKPNGNSNLQEPDNFLENSPEKNQSKLPRKIEEKSKKIKHQRKRKSPKKRNSKKRRMKPHRRQKREIGENPADESNQNQEKRFMSKSRRRSKGKRKRVEGSEKEAQRGGFFDSIIEKSIKKRGKRRRKQRRENSKKKPKNNSQPNPGRAEGVLGTGEGERRLADRMK